MSYHPRIPTFFLTHADAPELLEIHRKALESLDPYRDRVEVIVLENRSSGTAEFAPIVDKYASTGLVTKHYVFDENITANAFAVGIKSESELVARHEHVIVTDGDLLIESRGWLDEMLDTLRENPQLFCIGSRLTLRNLPVDILPDSPSWVPAATCRGDWLDGLTGTTYLLLRVKDLMGYMKWCDENDQSFVDLTMHQYARTVIKRPWARTMRATFYHLTWDMHAADPANQYRRKRIDTGRERMWLHNRVSAFSIRAFDSK